MLPAAHGEHQSLETGAANGEHRGDLIGSHKNTDDGLLHAFIFSQTAGRLVPGDC